MVANQSRNVRVVFDYVDRWFHATIVAGKCDDFDTTGEGWGPNTALENLVAAWRSKAARTTSDWNWDDTWGLYSEGLDGIRERSRRSSFSAKSRSISFTSCASFAGSCSVSA